MRKETVSETVNRIDGRYIDEATLFALNGEGGEASQPSAPAGRFRLRLPGLKWAAAAACLVLIAGIVLAAAAISAEAKEYREAVAFFAENGLPADGLSRSEVKEVYRDITEKRFSYGKTAEVMRQVVPGWEVQGFEPTPEELAAAWDKTARPDPISEKGISYRIVSKYSEKHNYEVLEKSTLECYRDGEKIWDAVFTDFCVKGYVRIKDSTAVWGQTVSDSSSLRTPCAWAALVDGEGNVRWQRLLDHGFRKDEYIVSMLHNADGTWAVISRGDGKYLCLSYYDDEGKELSVHKTEVGNTGIWNAANLGDGYIVQLGSNLSGDTALLYKMDREGVLTSGFSYEGDDCDYTITDMVEFEGRVYLSAYACPKQQGTGRRREIADILEYVFAKEDHGWDISSEELTPLVRDNYTAILLVCDPEGGAPETFYSVKGSLGGKLSVDSAGQLNWDVESITGADYSPATNAFTIAGSCKVFRCTFDGEGVLTGQEDTGSTSRFWR